MKALVSFAVLLLLSTCGFSQDPTDSTTVTDATTPAVDTTTEPTQTTTLPPETTTHLQTTTTPPQTTTTPQTTPTPPETTTTPPETTTTPPQTTTTTPKTTSTTPKTTSTSTTVPSTTFVPPVTTMSPIPVPETGTWNVTEGNTTCIRAVLQIRFKLSEPTRYITLSPNATNTGSTCEGFNGTQVLVLTDTETGSASDLSFHFGRDGDDIFVENVTLTAPSIVGMVYNDTRLFTVKTGSSYLCGTSANVELGGNVTMEVLHIQVEAFKTAGNTDFSTADECSADEPIDDVVPIAVGCALLALVVVVLVAYLVGRRRSRQKGYQSV